MRLLRLSLLAALALLVAIPPALAGRGGKRQLIIFKDGFIVRGTVNRPTTFITDSASGATFTIPVQGSFYHIDDDVRTISFAYSKLYDVIDDSDKPLVALDLNNSPYTSQSQNLPTSWAIEKITPFDDRWQRTVTLDTSKGSVSEKQRLIKLTPHFAFVQAQYFKWNAFYFTRELGPEVARGLVYKHMKRTRTPVSKFDRRMKVYRFMLQAGWTEHAWKELKNMQEDFKKNPKQRMQLETLSANLQQLLNAEYAKGIEQNHKAGQYRECQKRLAHFFDTNMHEQVPAEIALKMQDLKSKYAATDARLKEVRRLLGALPREVAPLEVNFFKQAVATILEELTYDTVGRLETFLNQAQDRERARKQGRRASSTPQELLAFAISGWLLGDQAAERSPKLAVRLWAARTAVLRAERDGDAAVKQLAAPFANDKEVTVDVVARMVPNLPPAAPYDKLGIEPLKFTPAGVGSAYHVQLPPEYHHYRPFPVLIALHSSSDDPESQLKLWTELAARYGFIVMAPTWGKKGGKYQYTAGEHAAVLASLRDLRRRFQVDSDRVFLYGGEEGGRMAYDVGLSHPDLFAGVLPMAGMPQYFPFRYWSNARFLPFYAVTGELAGAVRKNNRLLFKEWIPAHYASLLVEYKGRGSGFVAAELESMFDWMSRKKRYTPVKDAGARHEGFKTMRETDNRFYWLSTAALDANRLNFVAGWNPDRRPAMMQASIHQQNQISVKTEGLGQVTVWLGPGMVNYGQKVGLRVNGNPRAARMIVPSLEVLLDELARTGDRQRLFWARIDLRV